jgi:phenylacetate-CoA ligase
MGLSASQAITIDVAAQADWLVREDPAYLLTYPSNVLALAEHFERHGLSLPRLRQLRTISEMLLPEVRLAARRVWNVPVIDTYSTNEVGYLALQCPAHEHYHVQSEGVLLEILDAEGRPCAPGETGRVVLTPLHNFATVLLRYEVGDYAEAGGPCPCGRGLPVITRILGRYRNLVMLPDGRRYWPQLGQIQARALAPISQIQVVQTSLEAIELRYAAARDLTHAEREALAAIVCRSIGHPFEVAFVPLPSIPRSPGGKFEDFICQVAPRAA